MTEFEQACANIYDKYKDDIHWSSYDPYPPTLFSIEVDEIENPGIRFSGLISFQTDTLDDDMIKKGFIDALVVIKTEMELAKNRPVEKRRYLSDHLKQGG